MRVREERQLAEIPDRDLERGVKTTRNVRNVIAICVSLATADADLAAGVHRLLTQRNRGVDPECKVDLKISADNSRVELITDQSRLLKDSRRLQHATRRAVEELELRMTA